MKRTIDEIIAAKFRGETVSLEESESIRETVLNIQHAFPFEWTSALGLAGFVECACNSGGACTVSHDPAGCPCDQCTSHTARLGLFALLSPQPFTYRYVRFGKEKTAEECAARAAWEERRADWLASRLASLPAGTTAIVEAHRAVAREYRALAEKKRAGE